MIGDGAGPIAWVALRGTLRADAARTVAWLEAAGIETSILSGDPSERATRVVADALGIRHVVSGASPDEKVAALLALQQAGEVVAAVGDGINDAPLLARAQVSIAMGGGSDLARQSADAVLLGDRLSDLPIAIEQARRTRRIIRQNLTWALLYNATALPLAACGLLAPWAAALGMSASSLGVVANALRLGKVGVRA
jgi:Cu2+-exporting ATPase